ncbi:ATP phosphoribosyltransferase [Helicobacter sp. MIT 99-5507]|uniref:ATP phosphoribosyltransferase n=1 Tax=Helicobacter sp. MIT 99-5507 TaxID=152489 RepID=UPI000E1ECED6|nr:ATP phosphoribosyltransferase [Helicobacter sp. MIT 99-5507]RDU57336.1 ATP phosphoribosyltransferase [Helicobacter sp. MIT 99-5507]
MITIALPKGRIADDVLNLFAKMFGYDFAFVNRKLILQKDDFRFLLVRSQDVPIYVLYQAVDLGVVGLDVLEETGADIVRLLDLEIGKCKVVLGSKINEKIDYNKPQIKIATKMPNITRNFFSKRAIATDIIKLYGSIELAPLVGLSDAIVDIVETGNTMKENNLEIDEVILESSAYLIANRNSFYSKKHAILDIYNKLESLIKK